MMQMRMLCITPALNHLSPLLYITSYARREVVFDNPAGRLASELTLEENDLRGLESRAGRA
jgi:hypothetical protein